MEGGIFTSWQAFFLSGVIGWLLASSLFDLTRRIRSLVQPSIAGHVVADTPRILRLQEIHNGFLDVLFSAVSCVVSVPFYTGFLPLLFWSGHNRLPRQMTLLIAFCDYVGNSVKDMLSAPRPSCPPVRRVIATKDEEENALEYGLPSSHTLNTVCLSGYLLCYILTSNGDKDLTTTSAGFVLTFLIVLLVGFGRIYLGMHSIIDIVAGTTIGLLILPFWLTVDQYIDEFIIHGRNVTSFMVCVSFLLCFAYPKPENPSPSFEYHTAFNGVALGIVSAFDISLIFSGYIAGRCISTFGINGWISGVQQTYLQYHTEDVPRIFSPHMPLLVFFEMVLIGIPTILMVKFCSKAIAKGLLPVMCNTLGIPVWSSRYIPALRGSVNDKNGTDGKQMGYFQRGLSIFPQKTYDIDTGIRFLQYAGLAWSVVDLVPSIFYHLDL